MKKFFVLAGGLVALANVACSGDASLEDGPMSATEEAGQEPPPALKDFAAVPKEIVEREYVKTPFGRAHPSCMHRINDGEWIDQDGMVRAGEHVVRRLPACDYAPEVGVSQQVLPDINTGGWVTDAFLDAPNRNGFQMFNYASSRVQVPANPPTNSGQTFYAFPALMTAQTLLQPVLQFGPDSTGGGAYWTISSWAILDTTQPRTVAFTGKRRVYPGDWVVLNLQVVSPESPGNYRVRISASSGGTTKSFDVIVAPSALRRLYLGASEIWNEQTCANFPTSLSFDTLAYTPDTAWNNYRDVRMAETEENHGAGYCNIGINAFFKYPSSYQVDMTF